MPFSNEWCIYYFTAFTEPWCHSPPDVVVHSTYKYKPGYQKLTDTYQCMKGYTTNSSVSDRTVKCTTTNNDTVPWTWSSANFTCSPGNMSKFLKILGFIFFSDPCSSSEQLVPHAHAIYCAIYRLLKKVVSDIFLFIIKK